MTGESFQGELQILEFWKQHQILERLKAQNAGKERFTFIEGPPYPSGEAHLGHLRNWAIKDCVLRYRRMQGYDVYARDGYDVHGLPIETKVEKRLGITSVDELKEFGEANFIAECKQFVAEIIHDMKELRERYGFWIDMEDAYQTSHPEYISLAWQFFKRADEKGLLYKDYKSVAWCPKDETTLSDYEIKDEYKMLDDPSIYVRFPVREDDTTTGYEESLLIWTTTPWTLQSNLAIAVHPEHRYAKVLVHLNGKDQVLIVAEALAKQVVETLAKTSSITFKEVLATLKGSELAGTRYRHIYEAETPSQQQFLTQNYHYLHSVILADFVTLGEGEGVLEKLEKKNYKHSNKEEEEEAEQTGSGEGKAEGTGLVHIAPGHGFDDYEVGKEHGLPIFSPVDEKGYMTEGKYKGTYFKDVDPIAIDYLKQQGYLLHHAVKTHKYPCCWRCKTPIVYRAVDQWWIQRSAYIDDVIKENEQVGWYPEFARTSFNNLMRHAGDWAISRQRFWGIPVPVFEDEDGNYEVIGSKEELEARSGQQFSDIHKDDLEGVSITNKTTGKPMQRVTFTTDVWFDAGCASFASHYNEGLSFDEILEQYYPINWITESEDQIRGWFSSLFNVGWVVTGQRPYNQVLYYKYVMDKYGQKMSKSKGNGISGNDAIERWGSDKTRYYLLLKRPPHEQVNFDPEEFSSVDGFFNTLQNLFRYTNEYLGSHGLKHPRMTVSRMPVEDQWVLHRLHSMISAYHQAMGSYELNEAVARLEDFVVRDFSKTYLKLVKERTEERDEQLLLVFNEVLKKVLVLLGPFSPFTAELLYQEGHFESKKESVFLERFPDADELLIKEVEKKGVHEDFEIAQEIVQATLHAREKAQIGVRWPLPGIDLATSVPLKERMQPYASLIRKLVNVQEIRYTLEGVSVDYLIKPNFETIKQDFEDPGSVIKAINLSKYYITEDVKKGEEGGVYEGVDIDFNRHILKEIQLQGELASAEFSHGTLILETHQDEFLLEEGFLRELIRRVQELRKQHGLEKEDMIEVSFEGSDGYFTELVSNNVEYIKSKVGAEKLSDTAVGSEERFDIRNQILAVSIRKIK